MNKQTLQAEVRDSRGKGPARRLRAQGKIPAVFYGPGIEPTPLTVDPKELEAHLRGPLGRNTLFDLTYDGKSELAMVKDLTVTTVDRVLLHVDFLRVSADAPVKAEVKITTTGRAIGVVKGGKLNVTRRAVPVLAKPGSIPAKLVIDVTEIDMFGSLAVKDLVLPEGVTVTLKPDLTLVAVVEDRRAIKLAEEEAEAAAALAAGAPPPKPA